jgi:hypothetical protein
VLRIEYSASPEDPSWHAELLLEDTLLALVKHGSHEPLFSVWVDQQYHDVPLLQVIEALEFLRGVFEREAAENS